MSTDLYLILVNEDTVFVVPQSIIGMLWLQTHFPDDAWDKLGTDSVVICRHDAEMLVTDAEESKLNVVYE